jgi:hypothetical protein
MSEKRRAETSRSCSSEAGYVKDSACSSSRSSAGTNNTSTRKEVRQIEIWPVKTGLFLTRFPAFVPNP